MERLRDHVAIVTGAGRGIGRAIAIRLADEGARVALAARTEAELRETARHLSANIGRTLVVPTDVTNPQKVDRLVRRTEAELGPVGLLVNNAGRISALGPTWSTDPDAWWADATVNLFGTHLCCRAVLPGMIQRGRGRIVNLAGGGTRKPFLYASAYGSSKAAIMRYTETLDAELKETGAEGVLAFAISPGFVRTEMTEQLTETESGRQWMGRLPERLDEGKDIPPQRAAALVAEIASGSLDALRGRFLHAGEDLDQLDTLKNSAEKVSAKDLRTLRMRL